MKPRVTKATLKQLLTEKIAHEMYVKNQAFMYDEADDYVGGFSGYHVDGEFDDYDDNTV